MRSFTVLGHLMYELILIIAQDHNKEEMSFPEYKTLRLRMIALQP